MICTKKLLLIFIWLALLAARSIPPDDELLKAARTDDLKAAVNGIKRGANINVRSGKDETPLHIAAWEGHEEIVKLLVKHGAKVNVVNRQGDTPLTLATNPAIVTYLLDHGADVMAKNKAGQTPLMSIVSDPYNLSIAKRLLENGAEVVDQNQSGDTPLLIAARTPENIQMIAMLLQAGSEARHQNKKGDTALHFAAGLARDSIMVKYLIQHDSLAAKPPQLVELRNRRGETALMLAAVEGQNEIVRILTQAGARVEAKDANGNTALIKTAAASFRSMKNEESRIKVITFLMENGACADTRNQRGETAVMLATHAGNTRVVEFLLNIKPK